jgi:hypothetical protein
MFDKGIMACADMERSAVCLSEMCLLRAVFFGNVSAVCLAMTRSLFVLAGQPLRNSGRGMPQVEAIGGRLRPSP